MTDDRWFRMCRDSTRYEMGDGTAPSKESTTGPVNDDDPSDTDEFPSWTVDELMGMYPDHRMISMFSYGRIGGYWMEDNNNNKQATGQSWRECWLQLVMWDRHKLVWDDKQSEWVKA